MFCRSLFVLLYFSFGQCVVCSSSIYGFWLPLWYLQTLLLTVFFVTCNSKRIKRNVDIFSNNGLVLNPIFLSAQTTYNKAPSKSVQLLASHIKESFYKVLKFQSYLLMWVDFSINLTTSCKSYGIVLLNLVVNLLRR